MFTEHYSAAQVIHILTGVLFFSYVMETITDWTSYEDRTAQIKLQKRPTVSGQVEQDHGKQKAQSLACPQYKLPLMTIIDRPLVKGCYIGSIKKKKKSKQ